MKKNQIALRNLAEDKEQVKFVREKARQINPTQEFSQHILKEKMLSPDGNEKYKFDGEGKLVCNGGTDVNVKNGIPDFTIFSTDALDEKERQASYHDNEEVNESFDEIVLRPYNYNQFHAKIWLKHLEELSIQLEKVSGKSFESLTVLNCGCGGGFEAQFFAEKGAKLVGFDISQLRVEAAATRFALNELEGFFYRGDAAILPFEDNSFDVVIYHDSLHHVPIEEIPKAIKEARRVSKKYIILSEAHDSPIRMVLESIGLSTSIEASGNYTFRFKKSLIEFWCYRFGMELKLYKTSFDRREHRPKLYAIPVIGKLTYYIIHIIGKVLQKFGNEALIILKKSKEIKYSEERANR